PPPTTPTEKQAWLNITNAKLHLYSLQGPSLTIEEINFRAPLAGPPASGELNFSKLTLNHKTLIPTTTIPVEWKHPSWTIPDHTLEILNLKTQLSGNLAFRKSRLPFQIRAALPSQSLPNVNPSTNFPLKTSLQNTSATLNARGQLTNPNTWFALSRFNARNITLHPHPPFRGHIFDAAQGELRLQRGTLQSPLFVLQSEELSLIGNGQASLNGNLVAVLRIVAAPETSENITRLAIGSHLSRWTNAWLKPLNTPDRFYRDLNLEGHASQLWINSSGPARNPKFIPFNQSLKNLRRFLQRENEEELTPPPTNGSS
ncbi:MAG: hypothetical protein AAGC74_13835, partial [Verrucomicrobiota bacterium]